VKAGLAAEAQLPPELAEFYKLLGNATRLEILLALAQGELCVCDVAHVLELTVAAISHQLKLLRDQGWFSMRNDGEMAYDRLNSKGFIKALKGDLKMLEARPGSWAFYRLDISIVAKMNKGVRVRNTTSDKKDDSWLGAAASLFAVAACYGALAVVSLLSVIRYQHQDRRKYDGKTDHRSSRAHIRGHGVFPQRAPAPRITHVERCIGRDAAVGVLWQIFRTLGTGRPCGSYHCFYLELSRQEECPRG
jgi:DNA-binding transcriptional ArsR family regulator